MALDPPWVIDIHGDYMPDNEWGGYSEHQYMDLRHMPLFLINKHIPPNNVRFGYTESTEQLVRSQRNSKGVVVAEKVGTYYDNSNGKRLMKFDNLEWPIMANTDYRWLQEQIEKFYCFVTYYDARKGFDRFYEGDRPTESTDYSNGLYTTGGVVTKKFYWGDFSAEPFKFYRDVSIGLLKPKWYINVKVNLIDCGEPYLKPGDVNYCSAAEMQQILQYPYRGPAIPENDY